MEPNKITCHRLKSGKCKRHAITLHKMNEPQRDELILRLII